MFNPRFKEEKKFKKKKNQSSSINQLKTFEQKENSI